MKMHHNMGGAHRDVVPGEHVLEDVAEVNLEVAPAQRDGLAGALVVDVRGVTPGQAGGRVPRDAVRLVGVRHEAGRVAVLHLRTGAPTKP